MEINVIIEISKNSNVKYEYDPYNKRYVVDRILYGSQVYPTNYGFIENTLDFDGDPLDVVVFSDQPLIVGACVPVRILGALDMVDAGEIDTKLIGVIACDPRYRAITRFDQLDQHRLDEIKNFFETYKVLQKKIVKIHKWLPLKKAISIYKETQMLYQKYEPLIMNNQKVELKKELAKHGKK